MALRRRSLLNLLLVTLHNTRLCPSHMLLSLAITVLCLYVVTKLQKLLALQQQLIKTSVDLGADEFAFYGSSIDYCSIRAVLCSQQITLMSSTLLLVENVMGVKKLSCENTNTCADLAANSITDKNHD